MLDLSNYFPVTRQFLSMDVKWHTDDRLTSNLPYIFWQCTCFPGICIIFDGYFFPDYGEIRKPAGSHSHARLSVRRPEGDMRRKLIGKLANATLFESASRGKLRKISVKMLFGKGKNFPYGDAPF